MEGISLKGECSTGTFIVEYNDKKSFWHWGLLSPDNSIFDSYISLLNPFSEENESHNFQLRIFGTKGLISSEDLSFKGIIHRVLFKKNTITTEKNVLWYNYWKWHRRI